MASAKQSMTDIKVKSSKVSKTAKTKKAEEVKTRAEQLDDLAKLRIEYRESRRSHQMGELVNPRVLRENRKAIARLMTHLTMSAKTEALTAVKEEK